MRNRVLSAPMRAPMLSMQQGCVAAWRAGDFVRGGQASLRDLIQNKHHAQLGSGSGSDSADPLFLDGIGTGYVWFPGTASNSVQITLANSTAYFYTITYADGTTTTDTQTSTGAGVLTFGTTDVKFAGLSVRSIVVTTDADHATVIANIDFARKDLWNRTRTTFSAVTGQAVTINRTTTSARCLTMVDGPMLVFGTDDYLEVAHHADLDPGTSGNFTAFALVNSVQANSVAFIIGKKAGTGATSAGWSVDVNSSGSILSRVSDGTSGVATGAGSSFKDGQDRVAAILINRRRNVMWRGQGPILTTSHQSEVGISSVGNISSSNALRIGANGVPGAYNSMAFRGGGVWKRELTDDEISLAAMEIIGVQRRL